jgi:hypothetical protein
MFSNTNKPKSLFNKKRFFTGPCCPDESECCVDGNSTSLRNCAWQLTWEIIETGTSLNVDSQNYSIVTTQNLFETLSLSELTGDTYTMKFYATPLISPVNLLNVITADVVDTASPSSIVSSFTSASPFTIVAPISIQTLIGEVELSADPGLYNPVFTIETDCGNVTVEFEYQVTAL